MYMKQIFDGVSSKRIFNIGFVLAVIAGLMKGIDWLFFQFVKMNTLFLFNIRFEYDRVRVIVVDIAMGFLIMGVLIGIRNVLGIIDEWVEGEE
jgi:hypothetical protein